MDLDVLDAPAAQDILEQLAGGTPPHKYVSLYSAGDRRFLTNVRRLHLDPDPVGGKIRFVQGSWGSGKTHFFRLLTEQAFQASWLVSTVELSAQETPFNKFEQVFFSIVRNIAADSDPTPSSAPFGLVLRDCLLRESHALGGDLPTAVVRLSERLFNDSAIDIDVRRVVRSYWETYNAESQDDLVLEEQRGMLLQWFAGEAHKTTIRKEFGVQKVVGKENARMVLASLAALIRMLGYKGLLILFDESEMTQSTMSKSNLRQAHNNLLFLLNEVGEIPGLFLVYAAVPEFFDDPKTGVRTFGALSARIGDPPDHEPRALDKVWNLDAMQIGDEVYQDAAVKIREIYKRAYPNQTDLLLGETELRRRITAVVAGHGPYEATSRWRVVVKETTKLLNLSLEGEPLPDPDASRLETVGALRMMGDE
jgi:hypothetical protein